MCTMAGQQETLQPEDKFEVLDVHCASQTVTYTPHVYSALQWMFSHLKYERSSAALQSCALYLCTGQYVNRTNANTIPCGGGDCASDCCEMLQPDLTIQQSIVPADGKILVGDTFTIKITVKNDGQWEALQATITTTPLSGLQYVGIPDGKCISYAAHQHQHLTALWHTVAVVVICTSALQDSV